jgi:hypothetical protein
MEVGSEGAGMEVFGALNGTFGSISRYVFQSSRDLRHGVGT